MLLRQPSKGSRTKRKIPERKPRATATSRELRLGQTEIREDEFGAGWHYSTAIARSSKPPSLKLGAVVSVTFKGVGPGGADIYQVTFEHGSTEWRNLDAVG